MACQENRITSLAEDLGFVVNEENRFYNVSANTKVRKSIFLFYSVEVHMGKINLCVKCLHKVKLISLVNILFDKVMYTLRAEIQM